MELFAEPHQVQHPALSVTESDPHDVDPAPEGVAVHPPHHQSAVRSEQLQALAVDHDGGGVAEVDERTQQITARVRGRTVDVADELSA